MKKLFLLSFSLLLVGFAAQEAVGQGRHRISGTVTDASGPVVGAIVAEKGNPQSAVVTTNDGAFSMEIGAGAAVLEVSSLGYQTKEVAVAAGQATVNVVLESDNFIIDDVVVTALGIQRDRKALGYGVDEVKGEAFTKAKETNVINSMAGRVAGLVVSQTAGGPSGSTRVILRGSTEMTGNNQPLYIVDGVPLDNTNFGSAHQGGGYDLGDGISSINADDIESMSVLKGPAASALYGSRASHGVILITTKKASDKESFSVEYNGTVTIDTQLARWDDVQQVYGMGSGGTYSLNASANTQKSWGAKADGTNMVTYFDGGERPYEIIPNNTSGFFRTGVTATNSAIVSTHSGNTGVRFTFTDMRNRDIIPNTNMNRDIFNMRANTSIKKVDFDFSVNYTHENVKNRPSLGDSRSNIGKNLMTLATSYNQAWLKTYQDVNGEYSNWNGRDPYNRNPYWDIYKSSNESVKDLFRFNGKISYNITKHFKLQGTAGMEINNFTFEDFMAPTTPGYETGRLQQSKFDNRTYNLEVLALYNNRWGDFDLNATLGGNMYRVNNATTVITAQDMQIRDSKSITSFDEVSVQPGSYRKLINSAFASVNLGWRSLLYLDATVRADQSSTLPVANNTYVYPSFSGSFVFSELLNIKEIIPYAKLRASWAQVGSDTDPYQLGLVYTKSIFSYPDYTMGLINNGSIPNVNLKPSMTDSFEVGLEMRFLKNRIGLDVTYYTQQSNNQIMNMATSGTTGYGARLINAGLIENKGIEITLNTRPVQTRDFTWDLSINFAKNSNKVLALVDGTDEFVIETGGWAETPVYVVAKVGEEFGAIMGTDFVRNEAGQIIIDPTTGLPKYDTNTRKVLGSAQWDWTGGLSTTFAYKNITLSALFDVKVGADLFSMSARAAYEAGTATETLAGREGWYRSEEQRQQAGVASGAWKPTDGFVAPGVIDNGDGTYRENDILIDPEKYWMSVSRAAPGMFVYDNSYVKVRELTLGYTFPDKLFKNKIKGLSLSFVARNPFIIWKNIPNIDPDSNYNNTTGMGLEYGSLPSRKSFGFNVNVKF
jgi:TonB-linked SusC/RagA family outer membrane protein